MTMLQQYGSPLLAVAVIELDTSGDAMVTWSYPGLDDGLDTVLLERSQLPSLSSQPDKELLPFTFSRFGSNWIYIHSRQHEIPQPEMGEGGIPLPLPEDVVLPRVKVFSICLVCKEFNPEKYAAFSKLLANVYEKTGTPLNVLQGFLKVLTTGSVGEYNPDDYPARDAFLATSLKDIIRIFGLEIILLWTALMMKKRVVVYCDRVPTLLRAIRGFPLFIWHRQDWDHLRPFVNMNEVELEDLEKAKVYCAGFIDPAIRNRQDLYDVFIDLAERTISVPDHAKADFRLGAFHKDLAEAMVEMSEDPEMTAVDILKDLTGRAREFVGKLEVLQVEDEHGNRGITLESLQERQLPQNMGQFLYAVAAAEGLTMY